MTRLISLGRDCFEKSTSPPRDGAMSLDIGGDFLGTLNMDGSSAIIALGG